MNETTYGPEDDVVPEALYLWRFFRVDSFWRRYYLKSMTARFDWLEKVETAKCVVHLRERNHDDSETPMVRCSCGFWGYDSLKFLCGHHYLPWQDPNPNLDRYMDPMTGSNAFGMVKIWGNVVQHEHGYRSQYAQIAHVWVDDRKATPHMLRSLRKMYKGATVEVQSFKMADIVKIPFYDNPVVPRTIKGDVLDGLLG